jgi:transposase
MSYAISENSQAIERVGLLEDRRQPALALLDSGESLSEVGRRIGCNPTSVMRSRDVWRRGGAKALRVRLSPGRPLKLDRAQRGRSVNLVLLGPRMHGYRTNLWTTARIAELIRNQFGAHYHRDHVGRLMHSLNWSPQKPERRALERDGNSVARWQQEDWTRIKKRYAAGCPPSLCRRIGLPFDPLCRQT